MPNEIQGVVYYSAGEVIVLLGVSRQTFWRWRKEAKVPAGHRFRDGQVLFTANEVETIREFATRVEPIDPTGMDQLRLFNGTQ